MYYDKEGKLSLTHYCMMGNRPAMYAEIADAKALSSISMASLLTSRRTGITHAMLDERIRRCGTLDGELQGDH
jgi:hypothetical protein